MASGTKADMKDLAREIGDLEDRYPTLTRDDLFIAWFLRAYVTDDEESAIESLCGGPNDKGIDAVHLDDEAKVVFIIQGKYRQKLAAKPETRGDLLSFVRAGVDAVATGDPWSALKAGMSPEVVAKLEDARNRVRRRNYRLDLLYVTLGTCSKSLAEEARRHARVIDEPRDVTFEVLDGTQVMRVLSDYLDGVAPPVPSLELEMESGGGIRSGGALSRFDSRTDIESWVFSMTANAVANLFDRAGTRLFARNVRGFLGSTDINRGMEATLVEEPEYFFYYNNGVTIVCDEASQQQSRGKSVLHVTNPQVINGQQTTRALARMMPQGSKASVLIRVIRVPRSQQSQSTDFEELVSSIVGATNWQNAIRQSDLMSNDRRQVEIERGLRKLQYLYLRKRMAKYEARKTASSRLLRIITKEELAQASAACDLDPVLVRMGKEGLFSERLYGDVFPNADPDYYLPRFWLMKEVGSVAKGFPERAYAKWVVLHHVWQILNPLLRKPKRRTSFRNALERQNPAIKKPLDEAIDAVFNAVLRFYRANRGTGPRAQDVSNFFKRRNLHKEFSDHWNDPDGANRGRFDRAWTRLEKALRDQD